MEWQGGVVGSGRASPTHVGTFTQQNTFHNILDVVQKHLPFQGNLLN